jgi:MoxR-like ATPase
VFANVVLADEINRAPPKTQAALLQAMQEKTVTVAGQTHRLPNPFFVLATQNPIEQEATYPLPEAQLDRFMFECGHYPSFEEEERIVTSTTGTEAEIRPVLTGGGPGAATAGAPRPPPHDRQYACDGALTRPTSQRPPDVKKYISGTAHAPLSTWC